MLVIPGEKTKKGLDAVSMLTRVASVSSTSLESLACSNSTRVRDYLRVFPAGSGTAAAAVIVVVVVDGVV